jgi:ketosteroid isomerase-like protein
MLARSFRVYLLGSVVGLMGSAAAQVPGTIPGTVPPNPSGYKIISPVTAPTLNPGQITLLELEGRFSQAVAEGGGKAFASWFADDAVTLNNGKPATLGRGAIALSATWDPKEYTLTWVAQGAQMGPSNDMGFTWGHYEGRSTDKNGQAIVTTGRYITVWKKLPNGTWKVAMDASAEEPPSAGECCTLPKP